MGKRITSLQEITTVTDNDFIPVDNQANGARKLSAGFLNDIEDALDGKQDALTAGDNINIAQDGTISATDTTYTAGTNVDITNGVISATDTTYTAGTNITITNGEISATDTDTLSGLTDTAISSPSDGDALVYDSTSGKWVNSGVASDIGDLNDVDITTPSNGQVLSYDSTSQEWVNTTPSAGSSVSVTQVQSTGTKIATVTVDGTGTDLYAPTPTEVVANPSGTGSTDLTKINIGGTIYDIPSGGSSSSTLAGLTDVDLSSPTNGQALVYDATNQEWINANVGGGGGGYSETTLWDDVLTPDTSGSDITLSSALTNYDQLLFTMKPANSTEITFAYVPVSELEVNGTYGVTSLSGFMTSAYFTYNSATSINIKSWASANKTQYRKIIGIKYGGGGSSSSSLNYSTEEQVVGTWIDGKPLYEITLEYTITNQGATASFDITTDMPITNTVRSCETIFEYEYQSEQYSLVNSPAVYYFKIGNTNSIKFNMGSGTVSGDLTATLRYTKNSD